MNEILFVVLDEFAEWEATPLAAAINQSDDYCVKTVSISKKPIKSIGGFTIIPDYTISDCLGKSYLGLILIGGNSWRSDKANHVTPLVNEAVRNNIIIGGICDASVYLGMLGLLNNIPHTSNMLEDLKNYIGSKYLGKEYYIKQQAVRGKNIITANGTASLEFGKEILLALRVMEPEKVEDWYRFYKLGYYEAMQEL